MGSLSSIADLVGLAVAGLALVATALCSWRGTRLRVAAAAAIATVDVGLALARARALGGHSAATHIALAAGLVALIALMIRFGLAGVYGRLVPDRCDPERDDDGAG